MTNAPKIPKMAPDAPTPTTNGGPNAKEAALATMPVAKKIKRNRRRPSSCSTIVPKSQSAYALNAMWRRPACRNMTDTRRQYCPVAMPTTSPFGSRANPIDAPRLISFNPEGPVISEPDPPETTSRRNTAPIITRRTVVADARRRMFAAAIRRPGPLRNSRRASLRHSGH